MRCKGTGFILNSVYASKIFQQLFLIHLHVMCKGYWQSSALHLHFSLQHKEKEKKKRCCPLDDNKLPVLERSVKSVHFKT